eukprot:g2258.t1
MRDGAGHDIVVETICRGKLLLKAANCLSAGEVLEHAATHMGLEASGLRLLHSGREVREAEVVAPGSKVYTLVRTNSSICLDGVLVFKDLSGAGSHRRTGQQCASQASTAPAASPKALNGLRAGMRVRDLKKALYRSRICALRPEEQQLIVGGKVLCDNFVLGQYVGRNGGGVGGRRNCRSKTQAIIMRAPSDQVEFDVVVQLPRLPAPAWPRLTLRGATTVGQIMDALCGDGHRRGLCHGLRRNTGMRLYCAGRRVAMTEDVTLMAMREELARCDSGAHRSSGYEINLLLVPPLPAMKEHIALESLFPMYSVPRKPRQHPAAPSRKAFLQPNSNVVQGADAVKLTGRGAGNSKERNATTKSTNQRKGSAKSGKNSGNSTFGFRSGFLRRVKASSKGKGVRAQRRQAQADKGWASPSPPGASPATLSPVPKSPIQSTDVCSNLPASLYAENCSGANKTPGPPKGASLKFANTDREQAKITPSAGITQRTRKTARRRVPTFQQLMAEATQSFADEAQKKKANMERLKENIGGGTFEKLQKL